VKSAEDGDRLYRREREGRGHVVGNGCQTQDLDPKPLTRGFDLL
jgi:hypothetical protein